MNLRSAQSEQNVVLIGGGHSHVFVLRAFGLKPESGVRLTIIAKDLAAPYSGMIPGFVAGHYALSACHIDIERLARFAGARLIHGAAIGVDRKSKCVAVDGAPPVPFDLLSINVGVTPMIDDISGAARHALAVKPISQFAAKWNALEARALTTFGPRRIAVIGGGAAGVELVLAARHRLRNAAARSGIDPDQFRFALAAGTTPLPTHGQLAQYLARRALADARVEVIENDFVQAISETSITFESGRVLNADAALISTKAAPPPWFDNLDAPRDAAGFLATRPTLQLLDDDDIFAVGDCASVIDHPREKAGVFAVRQGPIIAENLRRRANRNPARPYTPQSSYLSLVSLGDKVAIASRGPLAASGRWAWLLKDRIDRRFVDQFNALSASSDPQK